MFKRIADLTKYKAEKILVNLIALDIIEMEFSENQIKYKFKNEV